MFVFVKGVEGVSKETGREYQVLTLVQYVKVGEKVKAKAKDFFPERKVNLDDFDFGDIVKCEFKEPEFVGDFAKLVSVELEYQSPYVGMLETYGKAKEKEAQNK